LTFPDSKRSIPPVKDGFPLHGNCRILKTKENERMKKELYPVFTQACEMAKELADMPQLSPEQMDRIFAHMSNSDMETTIRTLRYAYMLIRKENAS